MLVTRLCVVVFSGLAVAGFVTYQGSASESVHPASAASGDDPLPADQSPADPSPLNPSPLNASQSGELKWAVDVASPDGNAMLQRFVEECVQISKGTLKVSRTESDSALAAQIVVDRDYRICRFETTQELYQLVMAGNPSRWTGPRNSVEQVSYLDAAQFCKKLTVMLRHRELIEDGQRVRLPTDAEWEYACRAGATTKYCFGDSATTESGESVLDGYAWHTGNAAGNDPSVGKLKPNRWKLADVHGYLWEFTQPASPETIGQALSVRIWGGSWRASPLQCGCSSIRQVSTGTKAPDLGFRCVIQ